MWQDEVPTRYICFYRRTFDDNEHFANLLFDTEAEAYAFGRSIPKVQQVLVVTEEEFQSYLNQRYQFLEAELQWYRGRVPRPYHKDITLIEEVDEPTEGGYQQHIDAIVDEREHIQEPRFRHYNNGSYRPHSIRPAFTSLPVRKRV